MSAPAWAADALAAEVWTATRVGKPDHHDHRRRRGSRRLWNEATKDFDEAGTVQLAWPDVVHVALVSMPREDHAF